MGGDKKIKTEESLFCVALGSAPVVEHRDVYVRFSPSRLTSFAYLKDDSDGAIYRLPSVSQLGAGPPTRLHYENSYCDLKFSDYFKRTIEQVHVSLLLQQDRLTQAAQLKGVWNLLCTFLPTTKKVVLRLAEPEEWEQLDVGERIPETMIYDDSVFFDIHRVIRLLGVFECVELHAKANAIQAEHVQGLVEFFNKFNAFRRLVIYISEFKLFLNSICVTENDGKFKSLNAKVKVTQFGQLVKVQIGILRIQFEDEFRALEFRNYE